MAYFPLFVELEGKKILVVGGGAVAARRVKSLLEFGCGIRVASPELCESLLTLANEGKIDWYQGEYEESLLINKPFLVLAAANRTVNGSVREDCRRQGIPVNDSACKENCDFYFPGLVKEGEAVIGITAGGTDHKLAAALSTVVRTFIRETWRV